MGHDMRALLLVSRKIRKLPKGGPLLQALGASRSTLADMLLAFIPSLVFLSPAFFLFNVLFGNSFMSSMCSRPAIYSCTIVYSCSSFWSCMDKRCTSNLKNWEGNTHFLSTLSCFCCRIPPSVLVASTFHKGRSKWNEVTSKSLCKRTKHRAKTS